MAIVGKAADMFLYYWGLKPSEMYQIEGYLHTLVVKNLSAKAGDVRDAGLIHRLGIFPGEGNGNPLQCSNLENPMDRGAWWATVHGVAVRHDWSVLAPVIFKAVANLRSQDLLRSVVNTEEFLQGVILWTQHPESKRLWTLNYLQSCQTPLSQNTHVSLFLNPTFWRQPQDK